MGSALSRRGVLAALLLAALLAVVAWRLLAPGGPGGGDTAVGTVRSEAGEPAGAPLEPPANGPTLTPAPPGSPRADKPTYTLTVRVLGVAAEDLATIGLQVSWRGRTGVDSGARDVRADPSGTTVIDVEAEVLRPGMHTLQVMAQGAMHLPAYAAVGLPEDLAERQKGVALTLDVAPERAGVLTGRVVDPEGRPVPQAVVVADLWGGFRNTEERGYGTTGQTSADGRFRLLSRPGERLVALAYAAELGLRASEVVALRAGETLDVGTIRLMPTQIWLGRVTGHEPLPGKTAVRLTLVAARLSSELPGIGWTRDGPARTGMASQVPTDGRFEVSEVSPGWWRVELEGPDWGCAASQDVLRATRRTLHTRDGPIALDAARARLMFNVTSGGKGLAHNTVVLSGEEQLAFTTDEQGYGCIVVRPDTRYHVFTARRGMRRLETSIVSAANGGESTVALELEEGSEKWPADLAWPFDLEMGPTCRVLGPHGGYVPASLALRRADGAVLAAEWVEAVGTVSWKTDGRLLGLSEARMARRLPPGEYVVRAEAAGLRAEERAFAYPEEWFVELRLQPE